MLQTARLQTAAILILSLAVFWVLYHTNIYKGDTGRDFFVSTFSVLPQQLTPAQQTQPDLLSDDLFTSEEGVYRWADCSAPCFFAVRLDLTPQDPGTDWAIAPSYNTDNFQIRLNGVVVESKGTLLPIPSYHGKRTWLTRLPAHLLREDKNQIDILLARRSEAAAFAGVFVGEYATLAQVLKPRFFLYYEWPRIQAIAGATIAILILMVIPLLRSRGILLWLAGVTITWTALVAYRQWYDFPFSNEVRATYYFFLLNGVYLCLFNFFDLWSNQNQRRLRLSAGAAYLVCGVAYLAAAPWLTADEREALLGDPFQLILALGLLIKAGRHYLFEHESRIVESVAIFIAITAALVDVVAQISGIFDLYALTRTLPAFIVATCASLFYRNLRFYESQSAIQRVLEAELSAKQAALERSYALSREADEEKLLTQERQRILQDMHDGVGGRLAALLAKQRALPDADRQLTRELQQSLQELLLIIDSLDPQLNQALGSALGALRERVQPWLQDQNIELEWAVDLPGEVGLGPERTMQVYRCVQEALNNVARHARARRVRLSAEVQSGDIVLSVADNGCGLRPGASKGRGMGIMATRMRSLAGTLSVGDSPVGCLIEFRFPLPADST